jgi:hypothetical protein
MNVLPERTIQFKKTVQITSLTLYPSSKLRVRSYAPPIAPFLGGEASQVLDAYHATRDTLRAYHRRLEKI